MSLTGWLFNVNSALNSWVNALSHSGALALTSSPRSSNLPRRLHSNHTCAHAHVYTYMYTHPHDTTHVHVCAHIHVCMQRNVCVHTTHAHMQIFTRAHTHTCTSEREGCPPKRAFLRVLSSSPALPCSPAQEARLPGSG